MSFGSDLDFAISTLPLIFNLLSTKRCMSQNFWAATCNHQDQISQYLWPWMVHRKLLSQTAAKTEHWYGTVQRWRKVQLQHQRQKGYGIWKVRIMNSSLHVCQPHSHKWPYCAPPGKYTFGNCSKFSIFTNWQQQLSSCWLEGQATHCTY
jgi:hypothetical protein